MTEAVYDAEIAPELMRLANRCRKLAMPFLAVVEYERDMRGRTFSGIDVDRSVMELANRAAAGATIDEIAMFLMRYADERRLPHNSVVLERLGLPRRVEDRK